MLVASSSLLMCSLGSAPGTLSVLATNRVRVEGRPVATVDSHVPLVNIGSFGLCSSAANPQVVAAQGAPQQCVPVTSSPWQPGSTSVRVGRRRILLQGDHCMCQWGGVITVTDARSTRTRAR